VIEDSKQVYEFDEFRLDVMKRQLTRAGEVVPLTSKAFDLLLVMVKNGGRDLTKDELLESVWPGQMLEEANLTVNMSAVRKALGEKAAQPRYIVTIPGRGYRFVANLGGSHDYEVGLVIQSETIAQITVDRESETKTDIASASLERKQSESDDAVAILARTGPRQIAAPTMPGRRRLVLVVLAASAVVLILASVFTIREIRHARAAAARFQQINLRQLTNDGRVVTAAISPDGKFYVFVHAEKEKYSLRLGQTNGEPPIELRPSADVTYRGLEFAPDGSSVYYVIEENGSSTLYRLSVLGGVPVRMRGDIAPYFALAPDNKRVAFVRGDTANKTRSVVISNLDGTNESAVLTLPVNRSLNSINLCWSPDSSTIALGATPADNQTAQGIFLLQIASGELKPLTNPMWREIVRMAWLKDGSGIMAVAANSASQEYRQVWLVALASGEVRRVTNDLSSYDVGLSATADSNRVLAVEHQQINNIWVAPTDDLSKAKQLTFGALNRSDGGAGLDWTPNGKIIYVSGGAQSRAIWIMDEDGANAKQLTPSGAYDEIPSVSGDSRFIVFDSNRDGGNEIWRANIDGSDLRRLTHCGRNSQPSVTPDGKWVVYRSTCDSSSSLWRVSIDGGEPKRLTETAVSWPWVSPDSKLIACEYSVEPSKTKLAMISIEGGPPVKIFDVPPQANFRYGIRWASDGKAITYRDWGQGIWRQSIEGGPPQRVPGLPEEKIYANAWSRDGKMFAFTRGVEIRDVVLISGAN
jgi:Tol biopolymer transport system component/DNA-binding winged helix-turn-helix (wHTH) protein